MMITDRATLTQILQEATILHLALHAEHAPHVVPVCFGVDGNTLYVHGRRTGRKMELLRADPRVGFSACTDVTIIPGASACALTAASRSVVGTARARIVEDEAERIRGLDIIMAHYGDGTGGRDAVPGAERATVGAPRYEGASLGRTSVIALQIESMTGKQTGPSGRRPPTPG